MARIRTVKPDFFAHEGMASCSPHARLLAIALLQLADRLGRMRWVPMQIHAHAFPYEPGLDMDELAAELEGAGYLARWQAIGKSWAVICHFQAHQVITGSEKRNVIRTPDPPEDPNDPAWLASGRPLAVDWQAGKKEQGTRNKNPPKPPQGGNPSDSFLENPEPGAKAKKPTAAEQRRAQAAKVVEEWHRLAGFDRDPSSAADGDRIEYTALAIKAHGVEAIQRDLVHLSRDPWWRGKKPGGPVEDLFVKKGPVTFWPKRGRQKMTQRIDEQRRIDKGVLPSAPGLPALSPGQWWRSSTGGQRALSNAEAMVRTGRLKDRPAVVDFVARQEGAPPRDWLEPRVLAWCDEKRAEGRA